MRLAMQLCDEQPRGLRVCFPARGENQGPAGFGRETSGEMNAGPRTGLRRQVPCPRPNKSRAFGPGVTTTSRPTAWRDALVRSRAPAAELASPALLACRASGTSATERQQGGLFMPSGQRWLSRSGEVEARSPGECRDAEGQRLRRTYAFGQAKAAWYYGCRRLVLVGEWLDAEGML